MRRLSLGWALLLSACTVGPDWHTPTAPLPDHWQAAPEGAAPLPADRAWWQDFGDPALNALVTRALADNPDMAQALARVDQARAEAGLTRDSQLPSGDATGTIARSRQSLEAGLGQISHYVPTYPRMANEAQLGLSTGWEIDLVGGNRRNREAALAALDGARAGTDAARLMIAGSVVETYTSWREAAARTDLLATRRAMLGERRRIMVERARLGEVGAIALDDFDARLAALDAALPAARGQAAALRARLTALVGVPVDTALIELSYPAATAGLPPDPDAGLPAATLRRRPDLRIAEARAVAANARIGAALAEFWPKFSLSGLAGFDTNRLGAFGTDPASVVTGAAGMQWRLLDFARVEAQVRAARGAGREAVAAWRGAVLNAGAEVESAYAMLSARRKEAAAREAGLASARMALARSNAARNAGDIGEDELLARRVAVSEAEDAALASRADAWLALAACYRAIGG